MTGNHAVLHHNYVVSNSLVQNLQYTSDQLLYKVFSVSAAGSPRASTSVQQQTKTESDMSNLKTMPKGLSASLPDLDSESWIEVKKRPRPSPARPKVSTEKVKFRTKSQRRMNVKKIQPKTSLTNQTAEMKHVFNLSIETSS